MPFPALIHKPVIVNNAAEVEKLLIAGFLELIVISRHEETLVSN